MLRVILPPMLPLWSLPPNTLSNIPPIIVIVIFPPILAFREPPNTFSIELPKELLGHFITRSRLPVKSAF